MPKAGLSVSEITDLLGFSHTTVSRVFTQNGTKNQKHPGSSSSVDGNILLMREVRGEWPDWLELTESIW